MKIFACKPDSLSSALIYVSSYSDSSMQFDFNKHYILTQLEYVIFLKDGDGGLWKGGG